MYDKQFLIIFIDNDNLVTHGQTGHRSVKNNGREPSCVGITRGTNSDFIVTLVTIFPVKGAGKLHPQGRERPVASKRRATQRTRVGYCSSTIWVHRVRCEDNNIHCINFTCNRIPASTAGEALQLIKFSTQAVFFSNIHNQCELL